jgi:hypothetical protein
MHALSNQTKNANNTAPEGLSNAVAVCCNRNMNACLIGYQNSKHDMNAVKNKAQM